MLKYILVKLWFWCVCVCVCVCVCWVFHLFVCSEDGVFFYAFLKEKITFDLYLVTLSESSTYALMSFGRMTFTLKLNIDGV